MKAIILAAGQGTRMKSDKQKVMHEVMGKSMLQYVADACHNAGIHEITIVVGSQSDEIRMALPGYSYAIQTQQLGTGHAVQAATGHISADDDVLVLYGDMPLITTEFIREFIQVYKSRDCAGVVAAAYWPDNKDFGRVYASDDGVFEAIVEARDMKSDSPHTPWVNTGINLFKGSALLQGLACMTNQNNQGEFYLTDVPKILRDAGHMFYVHHSREEVATFMGINTQAQLAEAARLMRMRINLGHMENGVQMLDPVSTYIDPTVVIAPGAVIHPGCILEGTCTIAEGAIIGAYTQMKDSVVGKGTTVQNSVLVNTTVGEDTTIGPFAYLRNNAVVGNRCRIGCYVEIKNSTLDDDTKMAHLAYIGDADVGKDVNIGCGAITVNYDGKKKYRTVINDGAFIGCNVNLVAPVEVGEKGYVAAGSTITHHVPEYSLAIARKRQTVKEDWVRMREEK